MCDAMPTGHSPQHGVAGCSGVSACAVGTTPFECAALFFAHATPYARVLASGQCPGQAVGSDGTAVTHSLGLGDLRSCGTGGSDREEQFWVLVSAGRVVTPIHNVNSLKQHVPQDCQSSNRCSAIAV